MPDALVDTFDRERAPLLAPPAAEQPQRPVARPGWSPARLAYGFYAVAATGAVVGQTWVAVAHVPWGPQVPSAVRVGAVLPFALCLELLAMALAAMADERMRLGERAYGFRIFSAVVAAVAVGILVAGHWPQLYWSGGFGVLSGSAYLLWLLHSAARRRDALRAAGKLADTAPDYGLWRRVRHPVWTARAAELAREGRVDAERGVWRPLALYESLRAVQSAMRDEKRRPAIGRAVEQVVRADQRDPRMAEVAVRTLDLDRLAAELASRVDYGAWADRLAPAVTAPLPVPAVTAPSMEAAGGRGDSSADPTLVADAQAGGGRVPAPRARSTAERVAGMLADRPDLGVAEAAATVLASRPAAAAPTVRPQPPAAAAAAAGVPVSQPVPARSGPGVPEPRPAATSRVAAAPALAGVPAEVATAYPATRPEPPGPDAAEPDPSSPQAPRRALAEQEPPAAGQPPTDTTAAVAYWRRVAPDMSVKDLCDKVGRSERTVRRVLDRLAANDAGSGPATGGAGVNGSAVDGLADAVTSR